LYKVNKKKKDSQELLVKTFNPTDRTQFINWRQVTYKENNIYPTIPIVKKKPTRPPTNDEIQSAYKTSNPSISSRPAETLFPIL
jgi:hypothetical protein